MSKTCSKSRPGVSRGLLVSAIVMPLVMMGFAGNAQGGVTHKTVVLTGSPAPGTIEAFRWFGAMFINNKFPLPDVVFKGHLDVADVETDEGIWSGRPWAFNLVAREGDLAPGSGGPFYQIWDVILNDNGHVAFNARRAEGIWSNQTGTLERVVGEDDVAPDTGGDTFGRVDLRGFNNAGALAFIGWVKTGTTLSGPDRDELGVWTGGGANPLRLIVRENDPAPGTTDAEFGSFHDVSLNDWGHSTISAHLRRISDGTYLDPDINRDGLWTNAPGSLTKVARDGDTSPVGGTYSGVPPRADIVGDDPLIITEQGKTAFNASLSTTTTDDAIFVGTAEGSLSLAIRTGDAVQDIPGATFLELGPPALNRWDQIAFIASVAGPGVDTSNDKGVWRGRPGNLRLIAREGDPAPGTPDGTVFGLTPAMAGHPVFDNAYLNKLGQVVFEASLVYPDEHPGATQGRGIFGTDVFGDLYLIARTQSSIEVAPGDVRVTRSYDGVTLSLWGETEVFLNTESGHPKAFNDRGWVAYSATFTDDSKGLFIARIPLDWRRRTAWFVTGSTVSLSQDVTVPSGPVDLVFEYLFKTTTGQLTVTLGRLTLGTISSPDPLLDDFVTATVAVDPVLFENTVELRFTLDGPSGSTLLLDNINFFTPDGVVPIVNGDFETGDLTGWIPKVPAGGLIGVSSPDQPPAAPSEEEPVTLMVPTEEDDDDDGCCFIATTAPRLFMAKCLVAPISLVVCSLLGLAM